MASYLGQEHYGRFAFYFQATQCDDCSARDPETTRYEGLPLLPEGWTSELRGTLLVALCEKCQDDDPPACYVRGCGAIEDLEEAGFPGQSLWVCPDCKASHQHQEALRQELGAEGGDG